MVVEGELPHEQNRRGGAGWWMDVDGVWRAPTEWPEDTPPLDGWTREDDGTWRAPAVVAGRDASAVVRVVERNTVETNAATPPRSRQAESDRRAILTVVGVLGGAALLLAIALILITQAGASDPDNPRSTGTTDSSVIFAAETDEGRIERQREAAELAPDMARQTLETLALRSPSGGGDSSVDDSFDPFSWGVTIEGCLDVAETVLVARSVVPVTWADQLECVPDTGRWTDRYLGMALTRTIDADVEPLIPAPIVHASGGSTWAGSTRQAYMTDVVHPATLQIVATGAGHNPRQEDPSRWKPSNSELWCAYAVDWIAVKTRWGLDVTPAEKESLFEMLATCASSSSAGADPSSVLLGELAPAPIERVPVAG